MSSTTETLLTHYQVDAAHARYVADLALKLFDASKPLRKLPNSARRLLEIGALLHNVGMHIDERKHHQVGRDIVLNTSLDGLDDDQRAVVACLVAFHRKKVRPQTEAAFLRLGKRNRETALHLAAMLRVADGLDASQSQSTQIESLELEGDDLHMALNGPHAADDGARATEKANLWHKVFGGDLIVRVASVSVETLRGESDTVNINGVASAYVLDTTGTSDDSDLVIPSVLPSGLEKSWQLQAEDTLPEAARKVLRRYFQKLLSQEDNVRDSDDPEAVHEMRVATRRLRASLQALGSALDPQKAQRFRRQLRAVAQALGAVRDRDVFLAHALHYSEEHDQLDAGTLAPLTKALERDRDAARKELLRKLDSQRYTRFKRSFATFITSSDAEVMDKQTAPTLRVRYAAGSAIWHSYELLRVYETVVPVQDGITASTDMVLLHQMRIAGKHFRYTLELFGEALGPKVDQALEPLLKLQDHLGAVQDIEVATTYVQQLSPSAKDQVALDAYVEARHADRQRLLSELPRAWEKVASATFRRRLLELIVKL